VSGSGHNKIVQPMTLFDPLETFMTAPPGEPLPRKAGRSGPVSTVCCIRSSPTMMHLNPPKPPSFGILEQARSRRNRPEPQSRALFTQAGPKTVIPAE